MCKIHDVQLQSDLYFYTRLIANWLATEDFNVGETGESPKNTSNRADVTLLDSIAASTPVGNPPDETET